MTERTVTVHTADHGPVTVPEPAWCTGEHPGGLLREEIAHTGPSIDVLVNTERGPRRLVELLMWQTPYPIVSDRHSDDVYAVAHLLDGDHFGYDVDGLDALAADLMEAAAKVRRVARRLSIEKPRGGAR